MTTRTAEPALPRTAWTPREVAASLGVPYKRVLQLIHDGAIHVIPDGQQYRIPQFALDDYLARARALTS